MEEMDQLMAEKQQEYCDSQKGHKMIFLTICIKKIKNSFYNRSINWIKKRRQNNKWIRPGEYELNIIGLALDMFLEHDRRLIILREKKWIPKIEISNQKKIEIVGLEKIAQLFFPDAVRVVSMQ